MWIESGILPKGSILLLSGEAKAGKTFLQIDMANSLGMGGTTLWGIPEFTIPEPVTTLYIENELGEHELQRRLVNRFGQDLEAIPRNVYVESQVPDLMLDTPGGAKTLARLISQTQAKVVILDPISHFMMASENDNSQVQVLIRQLKELIVASGGELSIVLSHHFGKPPAEKFQGEDYDPLSPYNSRGAGKWFDAPDTLITLQKLSPHGTEWKRMKVGFVLRKAQSPEPKTLVVLDGGQVNQTRASFGEAVKPPLTWGRRSLPPAK